MEPLWRGDRYINKIANDEAGMFSGQFHLAGKAQVIADENRSPGYDAGGEGFVMRVSEPKDPAIVVVTVAIDDFHQPEIPGAVMTEAMSQGADGEAIRPERLFDLGD
jgi:hypothetical protein